MNFKLVFSDDDYISPISSLDVRAETSIRSIVRRNADGEDTEGAARAAGSLLVQH